MVSVLKVMAWSSVLLGAILIVAETGGTYNLGNVPYAMIIGGVCVLIALALAGNRQQSPLCRIGLHKFIEVAQDSGNAPFYIYRCERCRLEKKVIKAI